MRPLGALRYFDARTSFDPIRLAKANPIMALMAVMSLVVLFMPKVRPPRPTNACGGSAPTHATDTPTAFRYAWPHSAQMDKEQLEQMQREAAQRSR